MSERPERPATEKEELDQMLGYFAKQGKKPEMRVKQIQNCVPFDMLDREETNLRFYGYNALAKK
jgi:hypothetical protein